MYLDTHVHMWELNRGDYTWISPSDTLLARDYMPDDLHPHLVRNGVESIILVQAAATAAETDFMLALARRYGWIAGVVGGINLLGERFDEEYGRLELNRQFLGIRLNGTALPEEGSLTERLLIDRLARLRKDNRTLDLLVTAEHLARAADILGKVPGLKASVNHLGIPGVLQGAREPWDSGVALLAELPDAAFKISGMITQAGGYHPQLLKSYIERLAEALGPKRLMFGSDWPVSLQRGTYDEVVSLFEETLPSSWTEEERELVRCGNAKRLYGV